MKHLILQALPWVLCGLAVGIWAANWPRLKKAGARLASGLALGPVLGIVLNGMHLWQNHMIGFIVGILWGPIITVLLKKSQP